MARKTNRMTQPKNAKNLGLQQDQNPGLGWWRRLSWISLGVGLIVIAGAFVYRMTSSAPIPAASSSLANLGQGVDEVSLSESTGKVIRWGDLKGQPRALFFGFTRCPEICPTTLKELDAAIGLVGPAAKRLQVQFVSVDPERDTPESLKAYMSWFKGNARGYTGTPDQIAKLAKGYRVGYRKVPLSNDDYTMDHTALVYLIDTNGKVKDFIVYGAGPEKAAAQIKAFLSQTL
jgi:protein SCO1